MTKAVVRSDQPQFGVVFGASAAVGDVLVAGTRPTNGSSWHGRSCRGATNAVDMGGFTNVIPFTHGRSLFRITGDPVTSALEKVCESTGQTT